MSTLRDPQAVADAIRRALASEPSTPRRARASRPRSASGTLDRMVDAAAARLAQEVAGSASTGIRPDGRPVTLAEKQALVARFGANWTKPTGPAIAALGPQASAHTAPLPLPPGHATPFGW